MSLQIITDVLRYSPAKNAQRLVLLVIANYANEYREAWPSVETIMDEANIDERTARRALRALEDDVLIQTSVGAAPYGCNLYYVVPVPVDVRAKADEERETKRQMRYQQLGNRGGNLSEPGGQMQHNRGGKCNTTGGAICPNRGGNLPPNPSKELIDRTKDIEPKKESAVLSMEADANAQAVASLSSDFDSISNQETEAETNTENGLPKPNVYKPRGRASTTRQERAAIEALYRAFEAVYEDCFAGAPFLKEADEISKHLEVLLAASKAGKTPDDMARATTAAIKAYANTDFAVTVASVCRNFLYKPKPTRAVAQTLSRHREAEDAPRRITNAERFRQMAENGGIPEL